MNGTAAILLFNLRPAWRSEQAEWGALLRAAGRDDLLDELPESPFRHLPRPGVEPPSPAPAALIGDREAA